MARGGLRCRRVGEIGVQWCSGWGSRIEGVDLFGSAGLRLYGFGCWALGGLWV